MVQRIEKTDEQWQKELTPEQYKVLRKAATDPPFAGQYVNVKADGSYQCSGCKTELFRSGAKFDSHSGWPSFWEAVDPERIETKRDWSMIVPRTEILCAACGGHLGHVFDDGPEPSGLRYCVNSTSLNFVRDNPVEMPGTEQPEPASAQESTDA